MVPHGGLRFIRKCTCSTTWKDLRVLCRGDRPSQSEQLRNTKMFQSLGLQLLRPAPYEVLTAVVCARHSQDSQAQYSTETIALRRQQPRSTRWRAVGFRSAWDPYRPWQRLTDEELCRFSRLDDHVSVHCSSTDKSEVSLEEVRQSRYP